MNIQIITLYRPIGPDELRLIKENEFKFWPPRLPGQPIFYPVTNQEYAKEITARWNVKDFGIGYVTRFDVLQAFMKKYEIKCVGAAHHTEWWIPADDLEELNKNMVGLIEVIEEVK